MSILNKFKKIKKEKTQIDVDIETQVKTDDIRVGPRNYPRQSAFMIKQVWITEKAGDMSHLRKYNFIVDKKANKLEIKKAIESIYGVKVVLVNIVNIKGKSRRMGRTLGRTSSYKKAIVTLKEGQKIDVMPT